MGERGHRNILLAIDGAGRGEKLALVASQILELHFFAVEPRPFAASLAWRGRGPIGHGVRLSASYKMVALS